MKQSQKLLVKSIYTLALTIFVSITAVFAWFNISKTTNSGMELEVVGGDNVSMQISITNNEGDPGDGLRLYYMVPEDEFHISIKFVNIADVAVYFDLAFIEVLASIFNFEDDFGTPIISDLSLLNVFSISYDSENTPDGLGGITRTYYSFVHLYYLSNNLVYNEQNKGLNILLLDSELIGAGQSITMGMNLRFMPAVYDYTNQAIAAPINLFQNRSLEIDSLSIIEHE